MLASLNWLRDYVELALSVDDLASRFAMSGLNHESTTTLDKDVVLDLEVTSNRGDLLGHIGIAREAAVLQQKQLCIPQLKLPIEELAFAQSSASLSVQNKIPETCPRYTARIIRNVKVGPSPAWLVERLKAVNIASINNIVDATNYVMMECGQPLHAFDYAKIRGKTIIVRPGNKGEKFTAIDHREYELNEQTITIADAEGPIAIAGIMGGADSEITTLTRDVVIESAIFTPLAVRRTARRLRLHSPSSYRFERRVDPMGVDWASLRCCLLILEMAGGTLEATPLETNPRNNVVERVTLRESQVKRVLGIDVPWKNSISILESLGCKCVDQGQSTNGETAEFEIPSFRGDLPREVDLIEEIARIWGYDKLSETTIVPTVRSAKRDKDVLLDRVRSVMVGSGYCEVLTPSCVRENLSQLMNVWPSDEALKTIMPMLEGASILRRSLIPSLLTARLNNQSSHNLEASLFETASLYHTDSKSVVERYTLGIVTGQEYARAKGTIEELLSRVNSEITCEWKAWDNDAIEAGTGMQLFVGPELLGWIGYIATGTKSKLKLNGSIVAAELNLDLLLKSLTILPQLNPINQHPLIERDLNFVLPETVQWKELTDIIAAVQEPLLQNVVYKETYRDAKRDGEGKKRVLIGLALQSETQTLTTEVADTAVNKIVQAVESKSGGKLLGAGA